MTNAELKNNLIAVLGAGNVLVNESMARHCSFRVGGPADFFLLVDRIGQLTQVLSILKEAQEPYFILGRGTNLLVGDKGYRGAVITFTAAGVVPVTDTTQEEVTADITETSMKAGEPTSQGQGETQKHSQMRTPPAVSSVREQTETPAESSVKEQTETPAVSSAGEQAEQSVSLGKDLSFHDLRICDNRIIAGAGVSLASVARAALEHGLSGLEFAAGIPGSVGGGLVMNAGAYGGEMKDVVESALLLVPAGVNAHHDTTMLTGGISLSVMNPQNIPGGPVQGFLQVTNEDLHFGYRHSLLKETPAIVLQAAFHLHEDDPSDIRARMMDFASRRIEKQPLEYPSAGSTFKRPAGYFAGKLIQDAGLRGYCVGGACVSEKHCGFVINRDHASADDIRQVIRDVQAKVYADSGVRLEPEVIILGEF